MWEEPGPHRYLLHRLRSTPDKGLRSWSIAGHRDRARKSSAQAKAGLLFATCGNENTVHGGYKMRRVMAARKTKNQEELGCAVPSCRDSEARTCLGAGSSPTRLGTPATAFPSTAIAPWIVSAFTQCHPRRLISKATRVPAAGLCV